MEKISDFRNVLAHEYMKNPIIIFAVIAVIAILGISAYTMSQNSSQSDSMMKKGEILMPKEETSMESTNVMMKKEDSPMGNEKNMNDQTPGSRYIHYDQSTLDSISSNRRVLFFYASWCPTCKPADADFTQNLSKIPEDVTVIRVNYNDPETDQEEKDLAKKYGITYQHTFVQIDGAEEVVTKWNGGQLDELLSNIK